MSDSRPRVTIYTDGGADPNPGPGGWGVVLIFESEGKVSTKELSGDAQDTTNNRMELTAAIEALRALKVPCEVEFYADSQYIVRGMTEWLPDWQRTNFKKGKVENADLWRALIAEAERHTIHWRWVKGHNGNKYNERADQLATAAMPRTPEQAEPARSRIYTRVSCVGGVGAWAALIVQPDGERLITGGEPKTTPNRLDLLAAIAALEALADGEPAQFFTANSYLHTGITQWVKGWKKYNWQKKTGGKVQYRDLWERLDALSARHRVRWTLYADENRPADLDGILARLEEPLRQAVEAAQHENDTG